MTVEYMITNSTVIWWFDLLSSKRWHNPANICWSSRRLQVMSWRRLQYKNFTSSKTSWRRLTKTSWRRLEDVFKTSRKTSWRHVLKTSWRHILRTSSRRLGGKQNFYWWYLYLTNLNVCLTNLCFTNYIWEI